MLDALRDHLFRGPTWQQDPEPLWGQTGTRTVGWLRPASLRLFSASPGPIAACGRSYVVGYFRRLGPIRQPTPWIAVAFLSGAADLVSLSRRDKLGVSYG
jgi:hypothetical protein